MSQFYTKDQINEIATVIGNEIKTSKDAEPTAAEDYTSFINLLDEAIGQSSFGIRCLPSATAWSNPITFEDINHPSSIGGVDARLGVHDFEQGSLIRIGNWIDLSNKSTIIEFLEDFRDTLDYNVPYTVDIEDLGMGTARFRILPIDNNAEGYSNYNSEVYFARKGTELLSYNLDYPGTNAEVEVDLTVFFDEDLRMITCTPENAQPPIMLT